jgi:hypothetical protein
MAASMGHINQQLGTVVAQNNVVIEGLQASIQSQIIQGDKRKPWRAMVIRTREKLIHYVDLIPLDAKPEI